MYQLVYSIHMCLAPGENYNCLAVEMVNNQITEESLFQKE